MSSKDVEAVLAEESSVSGRMKAWWLQARVTISRGAAVSGPYGSEGQCGTVLVRMCNQCWFSIFQSTIQFKKKKNLIGHLFRFSATTRIPSPICWMIVSLYHKCPPTINPSFCHCRNQITYFQISDISLHAKE